MPKNTVYWLIFIFILAFCVRFIDLGTHFAHYDDISIATDILKAQSPDFRDKLLNAIYDQTKKSYYDKPKALVRAIYENPHTRFIFDSGILLSRYLIVPANSNDAPLQYLITPFLVHKNLNYRTTLFLIRLPAFFFSILTVILMYFILRKNNNKVGMLCGILIAALSLENIIYAKQAYNYSFGCLASTGLLLLFLYSQRKDFFQKHWFLSGILTTLFTYGHYQTVFFLPAYYLANLYYKYTDRQEIKYFLLSGLINFTLCLPVLYFLFFINSSGIAAYTIGKYGEFLFSPVSKNFFGIVSYSVWFFLKNSFIVLTNTLTPITADKSLFWVFGIFFCGVFFRGLIKIRKQPEAIYIGSSLLTYLVLVIIQMLALTPTRQSLVYLPLFVYLITQGLSGISKKILYISMIIYVGIFLFYFPGTVRERTDKVDEQELSKIFTQYQPDLIVGYGYTMQATLFKTVKTGYNYFDQENLIINKPITYNTVIFFSTTRPLNNEYFERNQQIWNNTPVVTPVWTDSFSDYKIVQQKIITSNIEIEPNNWNNNGSNNLFLYILQKE